MTIDVPAGATAPLTSAAALTAKNARLVAALKAARDQIDELRAQVDTLSRPPHTYATFLSHHEDATVDVISSGRKMRVPVLLSDELSNLVPGQEVRLNESLAVVGACGFEPIGEVVTVKDVLDDERVIVVGRGDDERVARLAAPLRLTTTVDLQAECDGRPDEEGSSCVRPVRVGDLLTLDVRTGFVHERLPKPEVAELVLEEVPDVSYEAIGGLSKQIEAIHDAVELPFAHPELYREHGLRPPKGVLLYGPPGCGKTLIAKAVAASLARVIDPDGLAGAKGYFLNVKGPELLNKYVGETERHIRLIFARAREKASQGMPVVVFFDEMESLFRTRGSGRSSDVETTIVPQLLAEIDGVERLDNVIVIGASNREDMIDPAILRPGRLDVKIKINRPDAFGAREIFAKYLTPDLPLHPDDVARFGGDRARAVDALITTTVERMYSTGIENQFLEVTYASGDREVLYFKDFNSGAMIQNVVDRAKKSAIKDFLATGQRGIKLAHLLAACVDEFRENEDLPNTTNPDDWARVSGRKGERITFVRSIVVREGRAESRAIPQIVTPSRLDL